MTFNEAVQKINSLLKFGSKPGLSRITKLLEMINNPQNNLKFIHVAGTNGKGSVCCMLSCVLKESGRKTGLYVSPSVTDFCERIQINGNMIPKEKVAELTDFFEPFLKKDEFKNDPVTEFELLTAMAFKYFSDEKCGVVVLETGMGGKLDATNVIENPLCSVITSVSLDHTRILGNSTEKIAQEKLGIVKPFCPLVLGCGADTKTLSLALKTCAELNSDLHIADVSKIKNRVYSLECGTDFEYNGENFNIPLLGEHQIYNVSAVFEVLKIAEKNLEISSKNIKTGLKKAYLPCRFEIAGKNPFIILDGAHNPAGAKTLAKAVKRYLKNKKIAAIIGMFKDKDYKKVVFETASVFSKIYCVSPESERALPLEKLSEAVRACGKNALPCKSLKEAFLKALGKKASADAIVVFGSFSIMKEAKDFLNRKIK